VKKLSRAFDHLLEALALLAAVTLLAMVAVVATDIALRNTVGRTIAWSNEASEYALYLITLMTAPWLLRRGQHVRIDLLLTVLPTRIAWLMEALGDILGFAVSLVLVRYGAAMTFDSWQLGAITIKNLVFPEWWLLAPLPAFFVLIAIEFVFRFHRLLAARPAPRHEATSIG
jgi:TRAP-type C4-dicarboxylate transport system permease small subunit